MTLIRIVNSRAHAHRRRRREAGLVSLEKLVEHVVRPCLRCTHLCALQGRSVTKILEGANAKNADLDAKVGPYFTLPVFRAALSLI